MNYGFTPRGVSMSEAQQHRDSDPNWLDEPEEEEEEYSQELDPDFQNDLERDSRD